MKKLLLALLVAGTLMAGCDKEKEEKTPTGLGAIEYLDVPYRVNIGSIQLWENPGTATPYLYTITLTDTRWSNSVKLEIYSTTLGFGSAEYHHFGGSIETFSNATCQISLELNDCAGGHEEESKDRALLNVIKGEGDNYDFTLELISDDPLSCVRIEWEGELVPTESKK